MFLCGLRLHYIFTLPDCINIANLNYPDLLLKIINGFSGWTGAKISSLRLLMCQMPVAEGGVRIGVRPYIVVMLVKTVNRMIRPVLLMHWKVLNICQVMKPAGNQINL
jgi:hypothetical protein